jgi:hypothetical protein
MTYGKRLDASIKYAKTDRKKLSSALGCTPQALGIVITGSGYLSVTNHAKAALTLGVDGYWLATGEGEMVLPSTTAKAAAPIAPDLVMVVQLIEAMPQDQRQNAVMEVVQVLVGYIPRASEPATQAQSTFATQASTRA